MFLRRTPKFLDQLWKLLQKLYVCCYNCYIKVMCMYKSYKVICMHAYKSYIKVT